MKLHVSACNGHSQVSTRIKKSIYLCEGMLMKRSLCINPLFALKSSAKCCIEPIERYFKTVVRT